MMLLNKHEIAGIHVRLDLVGLKKCCCSFNGFWHNLLSVGVYDVVSRYRMMIYLKHNFACMKL